MLMACKEYELFIPWRLYLIHFCEEDFYKFKDTNTFLVY
jgi:hypothetical protein